MINDIFHNNKSIENNLEKKSSPNIFYTGQTRNVDINKLLNRVKENKLYEKKQKFIFIIASVLIFCSAYYFII
jgi:hypothetical protein